MDSHFAFPALYRYSSMEVFRIFTSQSQVRSKRSALKKQCLQVSKKRLVSRRRIAKEDALTLAPSIASPIATERCAGFSSRTCSTPVPRIASPTDMFRLDPYSFLSSGMEPRGSVRRPPPQARPANLGRFHPTNRFTMQQPV